MKLYTMAVLSVFSITLAGCQVQRSSDTIRETGDFRYKLGQYGAAASEYAEITQRHPGDWYAQYRLGDCLLRLKKNEDAHRALRQAYSLNPDHPETADLLAESLFLLDDELELFGFLRDRAETTGSTHAYLQWAHYAMEYGDADTARVAVDTAIAVDTGRSVEPYLAAADIAEQLGDEATALRRLRQAYGINPRHQHVVRRIREYGEVPGPTIALPWGVNAFSYD